MIRLTADHKIDAEVMTIPYEGSVAAADSKATPNITHNEPMIKYIAIIIMMLLVISIFAGWKCIKYSALWVPNATAERIPATC
jgi:hypothetical protein